MGSLFLGLSASRRGLGLLRQHPKLIPFALLPAFAALLLSTLAFWAVYR